MWARNRCGLRIDQNYRINSIRQTMKSYRPWAVGQNYFVLWQPCGVYGLLERHAYRYIATKKSSQTKNLPDTEKTGDFLLSSVKLYYVQQKKFEILNSIITKTTCIMRKSTKNYIYKTFKQFLYFSNCFRVIHCQTPIFKLEPSFYCAILVQSSHLEQK